MMTAEQATVTVFICSNRYDVTGKIRTRYSKGLTIEDERGVIHYATYERVIFHADAREYLW